MADLGIIEEKGHKGTQDIIYKRDILSPFYVPFCQTLPWARIKYCGRSQGGSKVPVVTYCVAAQGIIDKKGIKGTYVLSDYHALGRK